VQRRHVAQSKETRAQRRIRARTEVGLNAPDKTYEVRMSFPNREQKLATVANPSESATGTNRDFADALPE
jgi:hypothetical protein